MFEKIRLFASDSFTHVGAAVFIGAAESHPWIAAMAVGLAVLLITNGIYHLVQKRRKCRPELCKVEVGVTHV